MGRALVTTIPPTADDRFTSGVALAIAGTFLFALKSIFIKLAFSVGADATLLLTLRLAISCPFYCGMLLYLKRRQWIEQQACLLPGTSNDRKEDPTMHQIGAALLLGFLGYYLASFLDMAGLERISAQMERLTLFTYPALIAFLAWMFLSEPLTKKIVAAIGLCYAGIAIMYSQERSLPNGGDVTSGVLLVMGSALSYSLYVLFAKPLMLKIGSREFTSYAMIGSTVFIGIHFALTRSVHEILAANSAIWAYSVVIAFVCTVVPSFLVNEAIVRLGATRTTIIGSVGPTFTMILAIVLLSEPSSIYHFAGMAVVVAGVALVAKK